jgi:hypothetical protein
MEDLVRATFRGDLLKVQSQLSVYPFLLNEVDQVIISYIVSSFCHPRINARLSSMRC